MSFQHENLDSIVDEEQGETKTNVAPSSWSNGRSMLVVILIFCVFAFQGTTTVVRHEVDKASLLVLDCNPLNDCGTCLQQGCRWCEKAQGTRCQSSLTLWNSCEGSVSSCPVPLPAKLNTCLFSTPAEWKLAYEAANLATLGNTPINVGTLFFGKPDEPAARGLLLYDSNPPGASTPFAVRVWQSTDKERCFIAFRGTDFTSNIDKSDIVKQFWADINSKVYVDHGVSTTDGFTNAVDFVQEKVIAFLQTAYANGDCKKQTTYMTGHSLGGAMANIAANRDIAQWGGNRSFGGLITFGSPRPWTQSCNSALLQKLPQLNWRFVRKVPSLNLDWGTWSGYDAIPQLAPESWLSAQHTHCADRAIALNENAYKDIDGEVGKVTDPTDLGRNDPPTPFNIAPALASVWWIHDSYGYALALKQYADAAPQSKCT